ncbi:MAG: twin-arginine translocase TatA/TatE family subunit [Bacteroidaceae bacterium]|jgi:sec-independent protein translocase protein TatA|nr:twin-arginine translocase TatA/TatE family subunit [Bacteroidaceae bacterium]
MFGRIGIWQIVLIVIVVLLLFGGKKIPELMKGLGKGVRSFKEGMNGEDTDKTSEKSSKNTDTDEKAAE